jgi:organic radical activating enzyme
MVNTSGSIDFCCIAKPSVLRDEDNKILDISRTTLRDAWNGRDMRDIRSAMLAGKSIDSCKHCYLQEEVGKISFRQMHNDEWTNRIGAEEIDRLVEYSKENEYAVNAPPAYLDLRLGNLCNLTCRMCNSYNSSQIAKEHKKLIDVDADYTAIHNKTYGKTPDWVYSKEYQTKFDADTFWDNVNEWLPTLRKVYMTGGEPTMIKNNMEFLNRAAEQGHAEHINVFMNTNLTNVNRRFTESISKFQEVDINASLDGVGEVNEYIRGARSWETLVKNYKEILKLPNINSNITPVLQIYNLNRIHEVLLFADEISDEIYGIRNTKTVGVDILINTHPHYLDVRNLPIELRQDAARRIEEFRDEYTLYERHWLVRNSIDGVLGYLQQPQLENWHENLTDFVKYTEILDRQRNQNFSAVDNELYQAIRDLI